MTCLLAIESNKLDDIITVDEVIKKAYGSGIYIEVGEKMSLRDMLYGLMLRSGNELAWTKKQLVRMKADLIIWHSIFYINLLDTSD